MVPILGARRVVSRNILRQTVRMTLNNTRLPNFHRCFTRRVQIVTPTLARRVNRRHITSSTFKRQVTMNHFLPLHEGVPIVNSVIVVRGRRTQRIHRHTTSITRAKFRNISTHLLRHVALTSFEHRHQQFQISRHPYHQQPRRRVRNRSFNRHRRVVINTTTNRGQLAQSTRGSLARYLITLGHQWRVHAVMVANSVFMRHNTITSRNAIRIFIRRARTFSRHIGHPRHQPNGIINMSLVTTRRRRHQTLTQFVQHHRRAVSARRAVHHQIVQFTTKAIGSLISPHTRSGVQTAHFTMRRIQHPLNSTSTVSRRIMLSRHITKRNTIRTRVGRVRGHLHTGQSRHTILNTRLSVTSALRTRNRHRHAQTRRPGRRPQQLRTPRRQTNRRK